MTRITVAFLYLLFPLFSVAATLSAPGDSAPKPPAPLADRDRNGISDDFQGRLAAARPADTFKVVVTFRGPGDARTARQAVGHFPVRREFKLIRGFAATMTAAQIRALATMAGVFRIEEDFRVSINLDAAQRDFGTNAARSGFGVSGNDLGICIVDTGVDPNHEQLDSKAPIPFDDSVNGRTTAYDDHGHGTHVASIAAGDGAGGTNAARYRGVAPAAAIYAAKVMDASGFGEDSAVIAGIQWCAGQPGVRVISMSLGSGAPSDGADSLSQAVNAAVDRGKVVVVAAGNSGDEPGTVEAPGAAEKAITAAACAEWSAPVPQSNHSEGLYLTAFSSRGPTVDGRVKPDVCAPGHSVTAAQANVVNGYVTYSGTSMATPFVSGSVALALSANPALTPTEVKLLVETTAQDRGPAGKDNDWGAGVLDAYGLVAKATGATSYTPTPFPAYQRAAASVANHGVWNQSFSVGDLTTPIAAAITINGAPNCVLPLLGSCLIYEWTPDLDAQLIDPNGNVLATSGCAGYGECGAIGRQETLHAMPSVAGTYRIEVTPAEDSVNQGKGGSFVVDLSTGPVNSPNQRPTANAGGPYSGTEDTTVAFNASGSTDPDGDSLTYTWNFGDGATLTTASPFAGHTYLYGATFSVTLTADDGRGSTATQSTTATVAEVNDQSVANAGGPYSGQKNKPITFDASKSYDPDNQDASSTNNQTLSYEWDFGDGVRVTTTSVKTTHAYAASGTYAATLRVFDGVVYSDPKTAAVTVRSGKR